MIPGTILNAQISLDDGCIRMPSVEVGNLISGDPSGDSLIQDDRGSTLSNLDIDSAGNGSILVLTDPSQLAALQVSVEYSSSLVWNCLFISLFVIVYLVSTFVIYLHSTH